MSKVRWQILAVLLCASVVWVSLALAGREDVTKSFKVKKGGQLYVHAEDAAADIYIKVWNKSEVLVKVDGLDEPWYHTLTSYTWNFLYPLDPECWFCTSRPDAQRCRW